MTTRAALDAIPQPLSTALSAAQTHNAQSAPILSALLGDELHRIASFLSNEDGGDLTCFRLACHSFRAHSAPPPHKRREAFLRSRSLVAHAWSHPGFQLESRAMWQLAAGVGSVDVLEWLLSQLTGAALDASICAAAARGGQLSALQWLRDENCPWDHGTCTAAAKGGHLEVLRWARGSGCDWDQRVSYEAAAEGHLEVLRWAREHGSPWDRNTCTSAASGGQLEVLRWLTEQGCPLDEEDCLSFAQARGDHDMVVWINKYVVGEMVKLRLARLMLVAGRLVGHRDLGRV